MKVRLFRGRRRPWLVALTALALSVWYATEVALLRPVLVWQGLPRALDWDPLTFTRVLRNDGFLLGYSDLRGNPLWVSYRLRPVPEDAPLPPRPDAFTTDWRGINRVGHDDYTGSGFDRGHLAPNYAIARLYGRRAQLASFHMTNIVPQRPGLNRKLWQRLEALEVDHYAPRMKSLWVVTGPIFDDRIERLPSSPRVEVPDAFFRIWAAPEAPGGPRLLAFIVPQDVRGTEPLTRFATTVDEVESLTGFDFFPLLPDPQEQRLEAWLDADAWQLDEVARRPPRF